MKLTRVYQFSSSHRLHAAQLSDAENAELYGKCNNPYGHGHNYTLHVSVRGPVPAETGRMVDVAALDRYVDERVISRFDHRDMNSTVAEFRELVPTTENVAFVIDRSLRSEWAGRFPGLRLDGVFIEETARNTFELRSE